MTLEYSRKRCDGHTIRCKPPRSGWQGRRARRSTRWRASRTWPSRRPSGSRSRGPESPTPISPPGTTSCRSAAGAWRANTSPASDPARLAGGPLHGRARRPVPRFRISKISVWTYGLSRPAPPHSFRASTPLDAGQGASFDTPLRGLLRMRRGGGPPPTPVPSAAEGPLLGTGVGSGRPAAVSRSRWRRRAAGRRWPPAARG